MSRRQVEPNYQEHRNWFRRGWYYVGSQDGTTGLMTKRLAKQIVLKGPAGKRLYRHSMAPSKLLCLIIRPKSDVGENFWLT